ncbi:MAG: hypothetical protein K8T20_12590 [Planctomycetes bacterium]|nr:hypothetical protein [Planctomycetota bacterium]
MIAIILLLLTIGIMGPPLLQLGLTLFCLTRIEAPVLPRRSERFARVLRAAWILVTGLVGIGALALAWSMTHRGLDLVVFQVGLVAGCFLWFLRPPLTCGLMRSADVPTRRRIIAVETLFTVFYVACFIPMFEGHNGGGGGFGSAMFASVVAAPSAM